MLTYFLRRLSYLLPILLFVNLLTFLLFFYVNSPDDIARIHLGQKYITRAQIQAWQAQHGYDKPLFYQSKPSQEGFFSHFTETLFFQKTLKLFTLDFGLSDGDRDIKQVIQERYGPSLMIAVPSLFIGVMVYLSISLILIAYRAKVWIHNGASIICIALISISALFYLIAGQFLFAQVLRWFPISGYQDGFFGIKFVLLPITISLVAGLGGNIKWYRSLFLEEVEKDYVRLAYAKGLSHKQVLFKHVLKNSLLPVLTGVVALIPLLFLGSLLIEAFFGIPGLGNYTLDAIREQDFAVVQVMIFISTGLYLLGLILTDLSYALFDPRIRLP